MGLFNKKGPRLCPICNADISGDADAVVGHVSTHLDDNVKGQPSSGLRLECGCADAVWDGTANFPLAAKEHLERVHGMRR